jgi:hypothetical protein
MTLSLIYFRTAIYLVELGTHNTSSSNYDLQDVVFKINKNPLLPD